MYESKEMYNKFDELEQLKKEEEMPEMIKEYFDIVNTIDLEASSPPDNDIYNKILSLKRYKYMRVY
jgi:hypothetical protein